MGAADFIFDHVHLISAEPEAAAQWYVDVFGAEIAGNYQLRSAPQITGRLGCMAILIRGRRPGESPSAPKPMEDFEDYSSHNEWGTDHFGFTYMGDLTALVANMKSKGASFVVEPWEFNPGSLICYVAAPDGVSIEIVQGKP